MPSLFVLAALIACGESSTEPEFGTLGIGTASLETGIQGVAYSVDLSASGGDRNFTWTIASGTLPAGLSLSSTGTISGTPTAVGTSTFTVRVVSGDGQAATVELSIAIHGALAIATDSLPRGIVGAAYAVSLVAEGGDGSYTWSINPASLPPGLTLDGTTGEITGVPTLELGAVFNVRVESGDGQSAEADLSLLIHAALEITTTTLPSARVGATYGPEFLMAAGPSGPYSWSLVVGALPAGLSLESSTGRISGTPTSPEAATFTARVESPDGQSETAQFTIPVHAVLQILANDLPAGVVDTPYEGTVTATGGDGSYTWSIVGGALPGGFQLDGATGTISGTPSAGEFATFVLEVTSGDGQSDEQEFSIQISDLLSVATPSLPNGALGVYYDFSLYTSGGTLGETWSIAADTLPAGLSLDPVSGQVAGTPTTLGTATFTVQVDSGDGQSAQKTFTIGVYPELVIGTSSLPDGIEGVPYDQSITVTGGDGGYTWSIAGGGLPVGLELDPSTGQVVGTPTAVQDAPFSVEVTSADGQAAFVILSITIVAALEVATTAPASGVLGSAYSETLLAQGGEGSYTWSIAADTLPSGLLLTGSTGEISGTPTATGDATFTVQVDSDDGQTAQRVLTISVYTPLSITTASLPGAVQGVAYDAPVAASGGDGTYTWSVSAGALPAGVDLTASTGQVSGTPTTVESASFTLQVASGDGQTSDAAFAVDVELLLLAADELCSVNPPSAVVAFAEANLETVVRQGLGVSPSTNLTCSLVATLTGLNAGSIGISDLTGIQNLIGLTSAYLVDNSISDLSPLGGLGQLQGLNLAQNSVSDLGPLSGLTSLTLLIIDENTVTDLSPLSGLTSLQNLSAGTNGISDLGPLSSVTSLLSLQLQYNSVSNLSALSSLTNLTYLNLSSNAVSDLSPLSALTDLITLYLGYNSISNVGPLAGLTNLTRLGLPQNSITDVSALSGLTQMEYLFLASNSITDIGALAGMTSLYQLTAANNDISDISALQGLTSLTLVGLDDNPSLSDIQPLLDNTGLGAGDQVFLRITSVACSDISTLESQGPTVYNDCLTPFELCDGYAQGIVQFEDVALGSAVRSALGLGPGEMVRCETLWTLNVLDASSSGITSLAGLQNATGLTQLTLSDNAVTDISALIHLQYLQTLLLDQNDITDLSALQGLESLGTIRLDDNTSLSDIQPLLDNSGIESGDTIDLTNTAVQCTDVDALRGTGATVTAPTCPA